MEQAVGQGHQASIHSAWDRLCGWADQTYTRSCRPPCDGFNDNSAQRLTYLKALSPAVGTVWEACLLIRRHGLVGGCVTRSGL